MPEGRTFAARQLIAAGSLRVAETLALKTVQRIRYIGTYFIFRYPALMEDGNLGLFKVRLKCLVGKSDESFFIVLDNTLVRKSHQDICFGGAQKSHNWQKPGMVFNWSTPRIKYDSIRKSIQRVNPPPLLCRNVSEETCPHLIERSRLNPETRLQRSVVQKKRKDDDRFNSCQVIYSQFGSAIHQNDHQARRRFVECAQNEIAVVPDFHKRILFSDEAHFWLNGYVNKQNYRIWSEANPQVPVNWPPRSYDLTPLDYFLWNYVNSLVYADKPQTLDHFRDIIRRVIADIRPQMLEKVIENWTSRLDYIRASRGSHVPEIIFKM
ncbi:putative LOC100569746 [Trichonephila clavipes]|uniref:Putative LOC100569746 n=1 Tax=Trichonephila clavipes TaxID=2585209 RepID=A0A8X6S2F1_TRICX|nr:putative LOC100569746 [Trichonephila clavipes]